jgi:hypothetical protein
MKRRWRRRTLSFIFCEGLRDRCYKLLFLTQGFLCCAQCISILFDSQWNRSFFRSQQFEIAVDNPYHITVAWRTAVRGTVCRFFINWSMWIGNPFKLNGIYMNHLLEDSATKYFTCNVCLGFGMIFRNSRCPEHRRVIDLCNWDMLCFLCRRNSIFKYYLDGLRIHRVNKMPIARLA